VGTLFRLLQHIPQFRPCNIDRSTIFSTIPTDKNMQLILAHDFFLLSQLQVQFRKTFRHGKLQGFHDTVHSFIEEFPFLD
jgi:hypothetical protein